MKTAPLGSALLYIGLVVALGALVWSLRARPQRGRAWALGAAGLAVSALGLALPAPLSRAGPALTRLDEFMPAWQFEEFHSLRVPAPPERVYAALREVRADEIRFFGTLMALRRGGPAPPDLRRDGERLGLIDVATRRTFVLLADDAPRELVMGTRVVAPPGERLPLSEVSFRQPVPAGQVLAAMNFVVAPDGSGGSLLSTETRVCAGDEGARRRFKLYWRVIYPGSALIRRMWLDAIRRRATAPAAG